MSDAVFPTLPGLAWSVIRTPQWSTNVQASKSGRQYAVGNRAYPTYRYKLPFEFLRQFGSYAELQTLFGFLNARRGRLDDFLYRDPDDQVVVGQTLGVGNGAAGQSLQLIRGFGGFVEPVVASDAQSVYLNGSPMAYGTGANQYRIDALAPNVGALIFDGGVSAGATVSWSGTYYWRCRFLSDAVPFEQFMRGLWKADLEFETFRP